MSELVYRGKKLHYESVGTGEPLLLLHGNTASSRMFAPIVPLLQQNYRVITLDFLGCGQSERLAQWPEDLWYEWGLQAIALCEQLGLSRVNLIGCSGGALAAINAALTRPELFRAVIADSFEGVHADASVTEQIRMGRQFAKQNAGFRAMLGQMHGADWEQILDADTAAVVGHAEKIGAFFHQPLSALRVNLLLTGSTQDELFPQGHYERLFAEICTETACASQHIFAQGAHPAMLSNLQAFFRLCERFFG